MVSSIKHFIALLLLSISSLVLANPIYTEPVNSGNTQPIEDVCNLPAPAFFNILNVGPGWAQVSWTPVTGAAMYHIITREYPSGVPLNDMYVTAAYNSATVVGLPPGSTCQSEIWAMCNGTGTSSLSKISPIYGIPLLDLVECGLWDSRHLSQSCIPLYTFENGCDVLVNTGDWDAFRVSDVADQPTNYRYFRVYKENNTIHIVKDPTTNGNISFEFELETGGIGVFIVMNSEKKGHFTVNGPNAAGQKRLFRINSDDDPSVCVIRKMAGTVPKGCQSNRGVKERQDGELFLDTDQHLSASPNPFTNLLDVEIPFASDENDVKISLYDLQGRLVTSVKTPAGTPSHALSTEELTPGLYLLRVDTGNRSETIKVLKTQ